jgi:hypothetical protein
MQDATLPSARPGRVRTPRQVVRDLLAQLQARAFSGARTFEWTVDVRGMTEERLAEAVSMLAQRGYRADYASNEIPGFAHFILHW